MATRTSGTVTVTISPVDCGVCGFWFGLEAGFHEKIQRDGTYICCPRCKKEIRYPVVDRAEQLQKECDEQAQQIAKLKDQMEWKVNEIRNLERSISHWKGRVTTLNKKLATAGVQEETSE